MNLDFFNLDKNNSLNNSYSNNSNFVKSFINELQNYFRNPKNNNEYRNDFYTIDRFEGDFAVCENRRTREIFDIPKSEMPKDAKEGIIIKIQDNSYVVDYEENRIVAEQMKKLIDKVVKPK